MTRTSITPKPLQPGSHLRVVAPSVSLPFVERGDAGAYVVDCASHRFEQMRLQVSFGAHVREADSFFTSSIESRVADLHEAFADPTVDGIMTVIGGYNSNELLPYLDYELIAANPKFVCGFSDITALHNAIYAKTGLITYSGPHWSTFGMRDHFEVTHASFMQAAFSRDPIEWVPTNWFTDDLWFLQQDDRHRLSTDGWWTIQPGKADGIALGSNLSTLALLNGTDYLPDLDGSVLFVEVTSNSDITEFRRMLVSVLQQCGAENITALVIGRFQVASQVTRSDVEQTVASLPWLKGIPVLANVDFGHTTPLLTFPIGGRAQVDADAHRMTFQR